MRTSGRQRSRRAVRGRGPTVISAAARASAVGSEANTEVPSPKQAPELMTVGLAEACGLFREYPLEVFSRASQLITEPQGTLGFVVTIFGAPGSGKRTVLNLIHKKANREFCTLSGSPNSKFAKMVMVIEEENITQWILCLLGKIILSSTPATAMLNMDLNIAVAKADMECSLTVGTLENRLQGGQKVPLTLYFEDFDLILEQTPGKSQRLLKALQEVLLLLNNLGVSVVFTGSNKLLLPEIGTHWKVYNASQLVSNITFAEAYHILQKNAPKVVSGNKQEVGKIASLIRGPIVICSEFLSQLTTSSISPRSCLRNTFNHILKMYQHYECTENLSKSFLKEFTILLSHPSNIKYHNKHGLIYKIIRHMNPQCFDTIFTYGMTLNKTGLIEVAFECENQDILIVPDPCPCALSAMCQTLINSPVVQSILDSSCGHNTATFAGEFKRQIALDLAKFWSPIQFYIFDQTGYHCDLNLQYASATYEKDRLYTLDTLVNNRVGTIECDTQHESFDWIYYGIRDDSHSGKPNNIMVVCRVTSITEQHLLCAACLDFFRSQNRKNTSGIFAFLSEHPFSTNADIDILINNKLDADEMANHQKKFFKIISGPEVFSSSREDVLFAIEKEEKPMCDASTLTPDATEIDSFRANFPNLVEALGWGPESIFLATHEVLFKSHREFLALAMPISEENRPMDMYMSFVCHLSDFQIQRIAREIKGLTEEDQERLYHLPHDNVLVPKHLRHVSELQSARHWIEWLTKNCS
ncbi:hypothetical protein Pelo_11271 [Pelomyxa schiedti]|nr:hypothetical protein Pelo_11271 [Pelomyxa schiedti]